MDSHAGPGTVAFDLPGVGVRTLAPSRAPPALEDATRPTTIDGYTQPGSPANTDANASDARILVRVKGVGTLGFNGLTVTTSGSRAGTERDGHGH